MDRGRAVDSTRAEGRRSTGEWKGGERGGQGMDELASESARDDDGSWRVQRVLLRSFPEVLRTGRGSGTRATSGQEPEGRHGIVDGQEKGREWMELFLFGQVSEGSQCKNPQVWMSGTVAREGKGARLSTSGLGRVRHLDHDRVAGARTLAD